MDSSADKKTLLTRLADGAEGTTTFDSRADSSYRFRLEAKQGKLRFWLEDRKSKKQWQTAELEMKDFVHQDCVIPHATFEDYAVCFLRCLESPTPSDEFKRELVPSGATRNAFKLRLMPTLRMFSSMWTPTYCLDLDSVALEPVGLLAAKVRDQEEEIAQLRAQVKKHDGLPQYFRGVTAANMGSGQVLVWTRDQLVGSGDAIQLKEDGAIGITTAGVFAVNVLLQHYNSNDTTTLQLQVNGSVVASMVDSAKNSHQMAATLSYIFPAKANDTISAVYVGNCYAYAGSSIVIYQLR